MHGCSNQFIRHLLVEGSLKLKDSQASKVDVHCFLFTDLLLICKSVNKKSGDKVKVIRQPFIIDRIVTQELKDGSGFILLYLNEFKVANAISILYSSDTKTWLDYIKRAQELYRHTKNVSIASEPQEVTYYRNLEEDEDYDFPSMALLAASPRSSSRSSLVHSHSGSVDMSDTSSNSLAVIAPVPTPVPTPNLLQNPNNSQQQPPRAVSFELGDLRNPSLTVEDLDSFGRSQSVDNRSPISVTITSPRPERRAFLLRNVKNSGPSFISHYPNTLSVNVPSNYQLNDYKRDSITSPPASTSIQIPILSSPTKTITSPTKRSLPPSASSPTILNRSLPPSGSPPTILNRSLPLNANKPPLVKTKNITGLLMHSAPPSEGPSPVYSFDSEGLNESLAQHSYGSEELIDSNYNQNSEDCDALKSRTHQKRTCRAERRYHTADSIESMKKEKDSSIHKRLSWNYGQQNQTHKAVPSHCERILCNKHFNKCLSSESVYSSSGFSSTGSVPLSVGSSECEQCGVDILDHIQEMDSYSDSHTITPNDLENCKNFITEDVSNSNDTSISSLNSDSDTKSSSNLNQSNPNIKIDVSEVKDGISSVQITVSGSNQGKPSKADLKKMKEFLLTSYNVESS
jgi:pleckstrin domain-containing family G protein 5